MKIILHISCGSVSKAQKIKTILEKDKELALRVSKILLRDGEDKRGFRFEPMFSMDASVLLIESIDSRAIEFFNDTNKESFCMVLEASELSLVTRLLPDRDKHQYFYTV